MLQKLSEYTGLTPSRIREIAEYGETYYRTYTIKKRSGGRRTIAEPAEVLKRIQQALVALVFCRYPVSKYCTAYERGSSVKANAEAHRKAEHIVHMDIKNFFPSISFRHFYTLLEKQYSETDIDLMWKLVSYRGGLPIGSCASPILCNRILFRLDKRLHRLGRRMNYTRYADDLVFSSKKYIKPSFVFAVEQAVNRENFTLNAEKTRFMGSGTRKKVTGVTITDDKRLSAGLVYRKRLKSDIYNYIRYRRGDAANLRGRLAWLANLEPEYAARIKAKYGEAGRELWN